MQVGLFCALATPYLTPELVTELGRGAEERGFDAVWIAEHALLFDEYASQYPYSDDGRIPVPPGSGLLDNHTGLAYLAACTDRIRLATGISLLPQRNPVYAAKEIATVDYLSGGRVDYGVGVGWLREEFEACGTPWERRGARTDEYLRLLRALWTEDEPELHGEFWDLPRCRMDPKPVQQPLPVHIGGESDAALRRVARHGDGWHGFNLTPEAARPRVEALGRALAEAGRSLDDVQVTIGAYFRPVDEAALEGYAALGADQVSVPCLAFDLDSLRSTLDDLAARVLEPAHRL